MTRWLLGWVLALAGAMTAGLAGPPPARADIVVNVDQAAVQPLPGTPAGTYPLTVTGTAAGATRTFGLTLTVQ